MLVSRFYCAGVLPCLNKIISKYYANRWWGSYLQLALKEFYSDAGRDWGQEEKGTTEDEMAGWHHWFDGRESGWTPGVGDGQGGLVCCDSWGREELDTTEQLNWTELSVASGSMLIHCPPLALANLEAKHRGNTEPKLGKRAQWKVHRPWVPSLALPCLKTKSPSLNV